MGHACIVVPITLLRFTPIECQPKPHISQLPISCTSTTGPWCIPIPRWPKAYGPSLAGPEMDNTSWVTKML